MATKVLGGLMLADDTFLSSPSLFLFYHASTHQPSYLLWVGYKMCPKTHVLQAWSTAGGAVERADYNMKIVISSKESSTDEWAIRCRSWLD
jgi:hypothetical protein